MRGPVNLICESTKVRYEFSLFHNINILTGFGGSGKTKLFNIIRQAKRDKTLFKLDSNVNIILITEEFMIGRESLRQDEDTLYIVDEDFSLLRSQKFIDLIYDSGMFLLAITRNFSRLNFSISIDAVYEIYSDISDGKTNNKLRNLYGKNIGVSTRNKEILTEDSKSGFELLKVIGYNNVSSSKGNSRITRYLTKNRNFNGVIFADLVALGSFMPEILVLKNKRGIEIADCKSVEYLLLHNESLVYDKTILDYTKCKCNFSSDVKSLERFYTIEYTDLVLNYLDISYDKSEISDVMVDVCVREKLYSILWKPNQKTRNSLSENLD